MAKKVRRKGEEAADPPFEFPAFDARGFLDHEFEITRGMAIVGLLAVGFSLLSWLASAAAAGLGIPALVDLAIVIGFAGLISVYPLVQALHPRSIVYTKTDWAALFATEFFGWLALWFLLQDLSPRLF